ncbi:MAG: hypothetical protein ACTSQK_01560 [Candidatus Heimdallarchaeota archaeon]
MSGRRRAVALKMKIKDIVEGEFTTEQDGSKALHVKTNDIVRRARIMGKITSKVDIESDESILIDVEDETGTVRVKGGGTEWAGQVYLDMKGLAEGSTVDVVGLIRESSDGKVYINCELCFPVHDEAMKVLRDLEISKYYRTKGMTAEASESIETAMKKQAKLSESDEIKDHILDLLKKKENLEDGCTFDSIKGELGLSTKELEPELRSLQNEGDIFEPIPGTFKYV